jgi:tight adherence protein C
MEASVFTSDILTSLIGAIAMVTIIWVGNSYIQRDHMSGRIKALEERRRQLQSGLSSNRRRRKKTSEGSVSFMRQVVGRMQLLRSQQADKMAMKMLQCGWRSRDAVVIYFFCKLILPTILGVLAVVFFYVLPNELSATKKMIFSLVMVLAGGYGPDIIVRNFADRRKGELRDGLPDALDLMVICAEAGLSMDSAMNRVARELGSAYPELSEEIGLTAIELGFLPDRSQALENLVMRVDLPGVRGLVGTLQQTEKYGTPLAQALRVLSNEFRNERLMRAEEKAARLPALLTLPMIIFILPPLFIVLIGPAAIKGIDAMSKMH